MDIVEAPTRNPRPMTSFESCMVKLDEINELLDDCSNSVREINGSLDSVSASLDSIKRTALWIAVLAPLFFIGSFVAVISAR